MTRVEKETLLALNKLGRRTGHTPDDVMRARLWMRYKNFRHWQGIECGQLPRMSNQELGQYLSVTEKWIHSFFHRGLVESFYHRTKAGKMPLAIGPFFMITKKGQKAAREAA